MFFIVERAGRLCYRHQMDHGYFPSLCHLSRLYDAQELSIRMLPWVKKELAEVEWGIR
jgi:hypothetical protein